MKKFEEWELRQLQTLTLEQKERYSIRLINDAMDHFDGDMYISTSGGKDSSVLNHLIHREHKEVPAVYCNTGLEWSAVRKNALDSHKAEAIRPDISFKDVLDKYGYPLFSKEVSQRIYEYMNYKESSKHRAINGNKWGRGNVPQMYRFMLYVDAPKCSHMCCNEMKKKPFKKFEKESGLYPFIGTLADESNLRKESWMEYGCNAFDNKRPMSRPLSIWTEQDILEYIRKYDIEYPYEVYGDIVEISASERMQSIAETGHDPGFLKCSKMDRTGCTYCGFGCQYKDDNRFEQLKAIEPKKYEYVFKSVEDGGLGYEDLFKWIESRSGGKIVIKR